MPTDLDLAASNSEAVAPDLTPLLLDLLVGREKPGTASAI